MAVPRVARRRSRAGGESRVRLLDAAGRLFATHGYDAVSTRALAQAAGANVAAIAYYFDGKEGLYRAVIRKVIDDANGLFVPLAARLRTEIAQADGDRNALARTATALIRGLLDAVLGSEMLRWQIPLFLREFHQPSAQFPVLLAERINPFHDAVAELVAAAKGWAPREPRTIVLTHAFIGQCMAFLAARAVVCARLGRTDLTARDIAIVQRTLVPAALAMLGLPVGDGETEEAGS